MRPRRPRSVGIRWIVLMGALLGASACTGDPIVLASIDEPPSGPPGKPPSRCLDDNACPSGTFCERRACEDPAGMCKPFPVTCPTEELPVCGCGGVTYFNDCLRRAAGETSFRPGECGADARACRSPADCPSGGSCARLAGTSPMSCGPDPEGSCWLLPASCPADNGPNRWSTCAPPPPPGPPPPPPLPCVGTCAAIRTSAPHFRALNCGG